MTLVVSFFLGFFIAAVGIVAPGMLNMTIAKISVSDGIKTKPFCLLLEQLLLFFFKLFRVYFANLLMLIQL